MHRAEEVAAAMEVSLTDDEVGMLADEFAAYATDSGQAGYAQIGADTTDAMFGQINDRAVAWATGRAAELVAQHLPAEMGADCLFGKWLLNIN